MGSPQAQAHGWRGQARADRHGVSAHDSPTRVTTRRCGGSRIGWGVGVRGPCPAPDPFYHHTCRTSRHDTTLRSTGRRDRHRARRARGTRKPEAYTRLTSLTVFSGHRVRDEIYSVLPPGINTFQIRSISHVETVFNVETFFETHFTAVRGESRESGEEPRPGEPRGGADARGSERSRGDCRVTGHESYWT